MAVIPILESMKILSST